MTTVEPATSEIAATGRKRRGIQFSLRTLLVLITLLAVLLAGFAHWRNAKRRERLAAESILNRGHSVAYVDGRPLAMRSRWIQLLALVLPEDCLQTVIWVDFPKDVQDGDLAVLDDLPNLKTLHLDQASHITPAGLSRLRGLRRLEKVYLKETPAGDAGLAHLHARHNLQELWLRQANITSASIPWIASNRRLTHLDLSGAHVTDDAIAPLAQLHQLEVLSLADSPLTSRGIVTLCHLPQLAHLYLRRTALDDEGLLQLATLPQLRGLDIRNTPTTPAGRTRFLQLAPKCRLEDW